MTPAPPRILSNQDVGHGLIISKSRNSVKPAMSHAQPVGLPNIVAIMPRISSSTIAELSDSPKILSAQSATLHARINTTPNSIKDQAGEYLHIEAVTNFTSQALSRLCQAPAVRILRMRQLRQRLLLRVISSLLAQRQLGECKFAILERPQPPSLSRSRLLSCLFRHAVIIRCFAIRCFADNRILACSRIIDIVRMYVVC